MAIINQYGFDVTEALQRFGERIAMARRARQIKQDDLAAMAGVSRSTLVEIEKGSPKVAIGLYLKVLWAMNLLDSVDSVAKLEEDDEALAIMASTLKKRVRF